MRGTQYMKVDLFRFRSVAGSRAFILPCTDLAYLVDASSSRVMTPAARAWILRVNFGGLDHCLFPVYGTSRPKVHDAYKKSGLGTLGIS